MLFERIQNRNIWLVAQMFKFWTSISETFQSHLNNNVGHSMTEFISICPKDMLFSFQSSLSNSFLFGDFWLFLFLFSLVVLNFSFLKWNWIVQQLLCEFITQRIAEYSQTIYCPALGPRSRIIRYPFLLLNINMKHKLKKKVESEERGREKWEATCNNFGSLIVICLFSCLSCW